MTNDTPDLEAWLHQCRENIPNAPGCPVRKRSRQQKALTRVSMRLATRNPRTLLEVVKHHLSKGRTAADIVVWENLPMHLVESLIQTVRTNDTLSASNSNQGSSK